MIILITGAQGFVGSSLSDLFLDQGHHVIALGRSAQTSREHENYTYLRADTTVAGDWLAALEEAEVVINLAGRPIFSRWSTETKKQIYNSRILTTRNVVANLPTRRPLTLFNASGVGIYGDRGADKLTEEEPAGDDFLATLSIDWEKEARPAAHLGVRVINMRFGIILGAGGGALATMIPAFRRCMGGRLGSGRQWFPWLHIDDLRAAIIFLLQHKDINGPVNFCSPNPVTNSELTRTLADLLGRPAILPAPAFIMRMVLGEFAGVLLGSQRALPDRLSGAGFKFQYSQLRDALEAILTN